MRIRTLLVLPVAAAVFAGFVPAIDKPTTPVPLTNFTETLPGGAAKFEMIYVPGGEFEMGTPDAEPGRDANEGPRHKVKVGAFWLGKCEVGWDEFDTYWKNENLPVPLKDPPYALGGKPDAITRPTNPYVDETYEHGREGFPAICMTHHAAMMYTHWLRAVTKKGYRMPTEAEWEYACRAGSKSTYSFGDDAAKLGEYARFKDNANNEDGKRTTGKCGEKKPNAFGLHDMHGNVCEWVLDQYDPEFYAKSPAGMLSLNPVNPPTPKKWSHVARGGSFKDDADKLRSGVRRPSDRKLWMKFDPQSPQSIWWLTRRDEVGFRVAIPVDELPALATLKPLVQKSVENDED